MKPYRMNTWDRSLKFEIIFWKIVKLLVACSVFNNVLWPLVCTTQPNVLMAYPAASHNLLTLVRRLGDQALFAADFLSYITVLTYLPCGAYRYGGVS